ncbi:MAG: Outer membrane protein assembly factor BamA [bacterium]|nr:Outer membrane protein assembly factor BamA [bacterium]
MVLKKPFALLVAGLILGWSVPALAQAGNTIEDLEELEEELAEATESQEPVLESVAAEAPTALGRVERIEIEGANRLRRSVIRRQLAFRTGESLTQSAVDRSVQLLRRLQLFDRSRDGIRIDVTPLETEAAAAPPGTQPLLVTVRVRPAREFTGLPILRSQEPYLLGATFTHWNVLGDATEVSITGYAAKKTTHVRLSITEPQLFGGHQSGSLIGTYDELPYSIRTTSVPRVPERYEVQKQSLELRYRTSLGDLSSWWGLEWAESDVTVRRGTLDESSDYLASGTNVADGTWIRLSAGLRDYQYRGYPWQREGFAWSLQTTQSLQALGSEQDYGLYRLDASTVLPLNDDLTVLALGLRAGSSSGRPPHYEAPKAGGRVRGYTGVDYAARSALTLHTEVRFPLFEDRVQGVVFCDAGRGFDTAFPGLHDLEVGYGAGIRVRTGDWLPVEYIVSADIGFSGEDHEFRLGLGQWF